MKILRWLLRALILIWVLFPFYWAVTTSLKSGPDLLKLELWPARPSWGNYEAVFSRQDFGRNLLNSAATATLAVLASLAVGVLAAYPLARHSFRGRQAVLLSFLMISMFPQIAVLSGLFELIAWMGLYNTIPGVALSYWLLTLPLTVWILTSFMKSIPRGIEEAAILDGVGRGTILWRVLLPMMRPAFVTASLLSLVTAWNEFLFALTLTLSDRARTVPVAIAMMSGSSEHELPWGIIMAASVVVTLPVLAVIFVFQRQIVAGLTEGAVKG